MVGKPPDNPLMTMNIQTLDLNHQNVPQAIAAYLVIGPEGVVLVETGPGSALPKLLSQLAALGYSPADIKHVLVTHIHFDHAGAAGWWAQQGARLFVHRVGARHLIDPTRLVNSARRIYGDEMDRLWGEVYQAPEERVTAVDDGDLVNVAGLSFTAIDTPGHASHHHVYRLGNIAFTGDATGVRLPQSPLINLPAPPPEFDLELWLRTIDHLAEEEFSAIYPTHFGRVDDVNNHLQRMKMLLDESATFVRRLMNDGLDRDEIVNQYISWNKQRALDAGVSEKVVHQYETANPLSMSVDGIMRYWRKRQG